MMRLLLLIIVFISSLPLLSQANETIIDYSINEFEPITLDVSQFPVLQGHYSHHVFIYRFIRNSWQAIPFQIDFRNDAGEFEFGFSLEKIIGANELISFMGTDLGEQVDSSDAFLQRYHHAALCIHDKENGRDGCVYALIDQQEALTSSYVDYVSYDPATDAITTQDFRLVFSQKKPMLIEDIHWWDNENNQYGEDVLDTMQLIHSGRFLGLFSFKKTQRDYFSRLIGVIDGPVRVIRRTSNNVRIVFQLEAPTVYMDYIVNVNSLYMNTLLNIPFSPGVFLSAIKTYSTMDWNNHSRIEIHHKGLSKPITIDGIPGRDKEAFNGMEDVRIGVVSHEGQFYFSMNPLDNMPIGMYTYLKDDALAKDALGGQPGFFGNVGFLSDKWEQMESGNHRFVFKAVLGKSINEEHAYRWLR
ncbi:MAG: hypothetical protein GXP22_05020 [Gammaproteobacteria bacterium]|nr:hypothetical protein [Gammaproteobacteria bacterium]